MSWILQINNVFSVQDLDHEMGIGPEAISPMCASSYVQVDVLLGLLLQA